MPVISSEIEAVVLLDRLPASVARFDRALRMTYVNARLASHLGGKVEDLLGKTCAELGMTTDTFGDWQSTILKVFETALPEKFEYLCRSNGMDRLMQVWVEPEFSRDDPALVQSVLTLAVTNNKVQDLRIALQTQIELFNAFMDNSRIFAWMRNAEGRYVYANTPYLRLFRLSAEELQGKSLANQWPAEIAERFQQNDAEVIARGSPIEFIEAAPDGDGNPRTWLNVKFSFRPHDGHTYVGGVGIDVTEKIRLEDERRSLERVLSKARKLDRVAEMAAGVAHEFNNLLTTILGNVSLARMNPSADDHLGKIEGAALRAAKLSQHLVHYCGRGHLSLAEVDLNQLVRELVSVTQTIARPPITLTLSPSPFPAIVIADVVLIRQMLIHLITNAAESLPGHGSITVAAGQIVADASYLNGAGLDKELAAGTYSFLEVSDTGRGMDEATMARIFEPFFTTKHPAQMGLGLAAVQGIVREHHGGIVVRSQLTRGSSFKVLLPAVVTPAPVAEVKILSAPIVSVGRGRLVLVVDDEPEVRSIAQRALLAAGFAVRVAEDGQAGLEVFRSMPTEVSAVLLDLTMPRLGGPGTLREIKKLQPDLKVILTSGYTPDDATSMFTRQDLAGFLRKPFRPEDLIAVIVTAIGK